MSTYSEREQVSGRPAVAPPPAGSGPAGPTPLTAAGPNSSDLDANGRLAFSTWTGVDSLGRRYAMSEADKARWRDTWKGGPRW